MHSNIATKLKKRKKQNNQTMILKLKLIKKKKHLNQNKQFFMLGNFVKLQTTIYVNLRILANYIKNSFEKLK